MRESTRELKKIFEKDIVAIYQHNNSKIEKRSKEENIKSYEDKKRFYVNKWTKLLESVETLAQKKMCMVMIERANNIPKCF